MNWQLTDYLIWATNLEAQAPQLKCLGAEELSENFP